MVYNRETGWTSRWNRIAENSKKNLRPKFSSYGQVNVCKAGVKSDLLMSRLVVAAKNFNWSFLRNIFIKWSLKIGS